jgi:DNA polymerase III delta prime subunit
MKHICDTEKIPYEIEALEELAIYSQGDMRNAINNLQLTYNGCNKEIIVDGVRKMCDKPQPYVIRDILNYCVNGDINNALKIGMHLKTSGYSGTDITLAMINTIKLSDHLEFNEKTKIQLMEHVAKTAYIISKGVDTNLQLAGCIAAMANDTYS